CVCISVVLFFLSSFSSFVFFFFFQAEDGIRDRNVTGVQTCALPISLRCLVRNDRGGAYGSPPAPQGAGRSPVGSWPWQHCCRRRSEERRVGKEGRTRWLVGDRERDERRGVLAG